MLRLTDLLRAPVTVGGTQHGRVADVGVALAGSHPPVELVDVKAGRGRRATYPVGADAWFEAGAVDLGTMKPIAKPSADRLLLRDHVLDSQVVDLAGKRVVRVGDVLLAERESEVRLIGIEFGPQPLLRRLGFARLAERAACHRVDWADLHLASAPGHALQLKMPRAGIHSLDPEELAELIAHLPAPRAAEVIRATGAPAKTEPLAGLPKHRRRGRRFGRVMRARRHAPS